jgi:hypothetical protein
MITKLLTPLAAKIAGGIIMALVIIIGVQRCDIVRLGNKLETRTTERNEARANFRQSETNHRQTQDNYRAATELANRRHAEAIARTEARWTAIAEDAENEATRLSADYRRRGAEFVRNQQARATAGGPGSRTGAATGQGVQPAAVAVPPPGFALVPEGDIASVADAYGQLNALIDVLEALEAAAAR